MTATIRNSCTRRAALTTAAGAACALALTACGGGGDDGGGAAADGTNDTDGTTGGGTDGATDGSTGGGEGGGEGGAPLAALDDVPIGEAVSVTTPDGTDALLFRADETTVAAFGVVCTHEGGTVQPDGDQLRCPLHNSVFDAATGEVLGGPAPDALPSISVRIEGDSIVTG